MKGESVKIKGVKQGLLLIFDDISDFSRIEEEIKGKLASGFFMRGTHVFVRPGDLTPAYEESLKKLFAGYGLIFKIMPENTPEVKAEAGEKQQAVCENSEAETSEKVQPEVKAEGSENQSSDGDIAEMLVVNRTLRGGQEIKTKSSVLVCGNVNPGAQIIAGGSIDIRGKCLGMVHAGAYGNTGAFIIADRLLPTQIRIANLVARAPDNGDATERPERASIKDGQIVIEPIER